MHHTPLTWYEQENLSYKAHSEAFSTALKFVAVLVKRGITVTMLISAWIHKTPNLALFGSA
jgi:hypothetical protein